MAMHPVHIGTRRRPIDRYTIENIIVGAILFIVGTVSLWLNLQDRTTGELVTAAALAMGF